MKFNIGIGCFRFPWDWKNPFGYSVAVLLQNVWIQASGIWMLSFLLLFAGFCTLFGTLSVDIKECLIKLNDILVGSQGKITYKERLELIQISNDSMQFHADAKK